MTEQQELAESKKGEVVLPSGDNQVATMPAFNELLRRLKPRLEQLLTSSMTPERMMRILQNAATRTPKLLQCTVTSLQNAIVTAATFGLEVNTPLGLAFLIPYRNGRTQKYDAQFQIGYQGQLVLAYNSGRVENICAQEVYEKDTLEIEYGLAPKLRHVPCLTGERGKIIGYYAVVKIKDIDPVFRYMSHEEILKHAAQYSRAYQYDVRDKKQESPWSQPPDSAGHMWMCKKTVIIQACKTVPKSIDDKFSLAVSQGDDDVIEVSSSPIERSEQINTLDALADSLLGESCEDAGDSNAQ